MEKIARKLLFYGCLTTLAGCSGGPGSGRIDDITQFHSLRDCSVEEKLAIGGEASLSRPDLEDVEACADVTRVEDREELISGEKDFVETIYGEARRVRELNQWIADQGRARLCKWENGGIQTTHNYDYICNPSFGN